MCQTPFCTPKFAQIRSFRIGVRSPSPLAIGFDHYEFSELGNVFPHLEFYNLLNAKTTRTLDDQNQIISDLASDHGVAVCHESLGSCYGWHEIK